jgi:hypothetical protein
MKNVANKKLIEDLRTLTNFITHEGFEDDFVRDVAARALEEIEYLEGRVLEKQSEIDWKDCKPGDMK